jgi:anaerobic magnesium-protoporphyrin IX monomethyl ester cyclase
MNILLILPKTSVIYKAFNVDLPPLGLMYLAGSLQKHGHRVKIINENTAKNKDRLQYSSFDMVGITASTSSYNRALAIARDAKREGRFVVMGGYHTTFMDREAMETGYVDAVVRGEGEAILAELAGALENGRGFGNISGITYAANGSVKKNEGSGLIEDLDSLAYPARELIDRSEYATHLEGKKVTPMSTSRGCSHDCYFCAVTKFGKKWRARAPGLVVDEMEHVLKNNLGEGVVISDDNFTVNPQRVEAICDDILKRGLSFPWWCMSRTDTIVRNKDMAKKMAKAGCRTVFLGIESGEPKILSNLNKRSTVETARTAISILENAGITSYGSFMMGDSQETEEDVRKTIALSRKLNLEVAQFSIITPFPGTKLYDDIKDRITDTNWNNYEGLHSVFRLDYLTKEKIEKLLFKAYFSFYSQPRVILLFLKNTFIKTFSLKIFMRMVTGVARAMLQNVGFAGGRQ